MQMIVVDGATSVSAPVLSGGYCTGSSFIPDLHQQCVKDYLNRNTLRLFADDNLQYRAVKSQRDVEVLQKDLENLENWENSMEFHLQKCQVQKITSKRKTI